jgi:hypothetical protein
VTVWDTERRADVVHDNEWITIWFHPESKVIHHKIHKAIRGEAFRQAFMKGTEALAARGATKWLSDDRLHYILPQEDQQWAGNEWFPSTRQAGWRYWAIAKPEKAVVDLYLRRFAAAWSASGVLTELFTTPEEGMAWLRGADDRAPLSRLEPSSRNVKR